MSIIPSVLYYFQHGPLTRIYLMSHTSGLHSTPGLSHCFTYTVCTLSLYFIIKISDNVQQRTCDHLNKFLVCWLQATGARSQRQPNTLRKRSQECPQSPTLLTNSLSCCTLYSILIIRGYFQYNTRRFRRWCITFRYNLCFLDLAHCLTDF